MILFKDGGKNNQRLWALVAHVFELSTWEGEAGESLSSRSDWSTK